ncbi:hypothetical protein TNCT_94361 [Trichonephila clavata]|uniref:Uncharacterized protein n=1 Tax=Trichonephila clavata TaxID=2740835 RepID=A0A8X6GI88_TRICU|nr:hypothetical protein TNCT_94361 [Trichonephila clavata]
MSPSHILHSDAATITNGVNPKAHFQPPIRMLNFIEVTSLPIGPPLEKPHLQPKSATPRISQKQMEG